MIQATALEKPLPGLMPDPSGPRQYGIVDNVLEVAPLRGAVFYVACVVPPALHTFLREVLSVEIGDTVRMAIDEVQEGTKTVHVFSVTYRNGEEMADLWRYPPGSLPAFLRNPLYRVENHE